jgi:hypothetical protein
MKKHLIIGLLICSATIKLYAQKQVVHYNIVFAPDLSNRLNPKLYPKAVNDADIVDRFLGRIWQEIIRLKRTEGQQDRFSVDFINKGLIGIYKINTDFLTIDLQRFGTHQSDRIDYIMSRHNVPQTLPGDINKFTAEYRRFNNLASVSNNGADIWTYFQSGIDARVVLPCVQKKKVTDVFRNIMVLMTDGYIEAGIYQKGYDLSAAKVGEFRKAFLKSKESNMETFLAKNQKFRINPVRNPFLNNLEVIVLEMYDRSLSRTGAATTHPTDMEIMKLIWSDWMRNSGVKRFELKPIASNRDEAVKYILDFVKK